MSRNNVAEMLLEEFRQMRAAIDYTNWVTDRDAMDDDVRFRVICGARMVSQKGSWEIGSESMIRDGSRPGWLATRREVLEALRGN